MTQPARGASEGFPGVPAEKRVLTDEFNRRTLIITREEKRNRAPFKEGIMRRILFSAGWYAAGLVTIPLLMFGVDAVSARSKTDVSMTDSIALADSPFPVETATESSLQIVQADGFAAPALPAEPEPDIGAFDVRDDKPFGRSVSQPAPDVPAIVLPVRPAMLASSIPTDEATTAKRTELQAELKKVLEEKTALLSNSGLEMEIAMQQRHLAELRALQELLKLQQSLKELSDKYPDSDAGRRAGEMLRLLTEPRLVSPSDAPVYSPAGALQPHPSLDTFNPVQDPKSLHRDQHRPITPTKTY